MLKIQPVFKDYIWGGSQLKTLYNKESHLERVAESWELSTHPDGQCLIAEGEYQGKTLSSYLKEHGKLALGSKCTYEDELPILIKLIDAKNNLSVQVHPDDQYAIAHEKDLGKTEMWIVLEAEEGAQLVYGLKRKMQRSEFEAYIKENKVEEILNYVDVKKGDVFFIEPGTIHAIGQGVVIAEIQQSSNITYRVYDYNRVGIDGRPRELHVNKALEVSSLEACDEARLIYEMKEQKGVKVGEIAQCPYFKVAYIELEDQITVEMDETSFHALLLTEGEVAVTTEKDVVKLSKGESLFIPANTGEYQVSGKGEYVLSQL